MKKIVFILILIIAVMTLAKNKDVREAIGSSPQEAYDSIRGMVDRFVDYSPERFQELLSHYNLNLDRRAERYVHNISRSPADLLTFMKKYCDGGMKNVNLDKQAVEVVCKVSDQALYGN